MSSTRGRLLVTASSSLRSVLRSYVKALKVRVERSGTDRDKLVIEMENPYLHNRS